jgi:hypothetical protein
LSVLKEGPATFITGQVKGRRRPGVIEIAVAQVRMYSSVEIASVQNCTVPISNAVAMLASRTDCYGSVVFVRITPTPTDRCSLSGNFKRAFSAAAFVLKGFDIGVNSPLMYLNKSHCSMILGM